jgi:hypothetical protein
MSASPSKASGASSRTCRAPATADELTAAFDAASKDVDLLAEARKAKLEVDPVAGRELQALVDQLSATPKEVIDLVRKISAR